MNVTEGLKQSVLARTGGECHICHDAVVPRSYGRLYSPGGWEIDHSVPRSNGGTDRLNNLYAAHIDCNRSKGAKSTRVARRQFGYTAAPLSLAQRESRRRVALLVGAGGGALAGYLIAEHYKVSEDTKWLLIGVGSIASMLLANHLVTA